MSDALKIQPSGLARTGKVAPHKLRKKGQYCATMGLYRRPLPPDNGAGRQSGRSDEQIRIDNVVELRQLFRSQISTRGLHQTKTEALTNNQTIDHPMMTP